MGVGVATRRVYNVTPAELAWQGGPKVYPTTVGNPSR
jgi:hypothetical protein